MLGVRACGWPPRQPHQSFRLSTVMKRTFGPFAGRGSSCVTGTARGMTTGADEMAGCVVPRFFVAADNSGVRSAIVPVSHASSVNIETGIFLLMLGHFRENVSNDNDFAHLSCESLSIIQHRIITAETFTCSTPMSRAPRDSYTRMTTTSHSSK